LSSPEAAAAADSISFSSLDAGSRQQTGD